MSMTFVSGWEQPKLATIADEASLALQRTGLSGNQQKQRNIHPNQIEYQKKNNALREADAIFLTFFNETAVRNAVQRAQTLFKHEATINQLLTEMISATPVITIDQGTHQAEDRSSGGFKLHFDARRTDGLCFHFYVGQELDGNLKIIEISYMNAGTKVEAHPSA